MQTLRPLLPPTIRQHHSLLRALQSSNTHRSFLTSNKKHHFTATRILPYPHQAIFDVIADVSSYAHFLPYCTSSTVTGYSTPHPSTGKFYPQEAKLSIGFQSISEEFWSRVTCVPYSTVEAVSGEAESTVSPVEAPHHAPRPTRQDADPTRKGGVLSGMLTKWTLRPIKYKPPPSGAVTVEGVHRNHEETSPVPGQEKTEVNLVIEYYFANPLYGAFSGAAMPAVVDKMVEAFEKRVKMVVEGPGSVR